MADTHPGTCYCGAVALEASGSPIDMGYCHCENCRRYSGAPLSAFTLWKPENVRITQGA
ncbi:MAG: GFA family protein, partial [Chthoniobacterales bacterium]